MVGIIMVCVIMFCLSRGYRHCILLPFRIKDLISCIGTADFRNRRAGEAAVLIPAFKGIAFAGDATSSRQSRTRATGIVGYIFAVCNLASICFQLHDISIG